MCVRVINKKKYDKQEQSFFIFTYVLIIYKSKSKVDDLQVEGNQKASFSIATTPRCTGRCYSFPWISPLYPWYVPYIAELLSKEISSTILKIFGMTRPRIEPLSPGPLANTLPTSPINRLSKYRQLHIYWRNIYV